jgi:hypothetical protein
MMGDTGTGSDEQYAVAAGVRELCATEGCDFVVLLGDNLYEDGAADVFDHAWQELFERPYAGIDVPFYAVLGNHDYGAIGVDVERTHHQIAYSAVSSRWHMPAAHYTMRAGPVGLIGLDTTALLLTDTSAGDQHAWWPTALAEVQGATWVLAVGHHPYLSNGDNGGAEEHGGDLPAFLADHVCGQVDLYVAGHDHDREWLNTDACGGTELVISGAGGSAYPFARDEAPSWWGDDTTAGFLYVIADDLSLTGRFVDFDGTVQFERTLAR